MGSRRALLLPKDATNEGSRRLRLLLRKQSFGAIARRMRCDERSIRTWAREEGKPNLIMRWRGEEILGIWPSAWDEEPDVYDGADPQTMRPPETETRTA